MLDIRRLVRGRAEAGDTLTLPFDARQKSRQRAQLDNGKEAALMLPRGTVLRDGDVLEAEDGTRVEVRAADEEVSTVFASDANALVRAGYHLGNRHVPLQLGDGWVRYRHDHVLDEMVRGLGLEVRCEQAAFEPEGGAYGGHSHSHAGESPSGSHEAGHGAGHGAGVGHGHGQGESPS